MILPPINLSNDFLIYLYTVSYYTYYIILINMYLGLGLLQFISLLVFDSLWLSIATPKSYSVDVKLLQDVLKLLKWQLSALCRPVKVGATRNYKVVWRDVYTSVQSTCSIGGIGIFNKCLCILCQGMPTLTISSRQQTLSSRRLILSVESHGSEVFWGVLSAPPRFHLPLLASCIAPQEKDYPIQLTNWHKAQIGSAARRIEGILLAAVVLLSTWLLKCSWRFSVWSILYTKPGDRLSLASLWHLWGLLFIWRLTS